MMVEENENVVNYVLRKRNLKVRAVCGCVCVRVRVCVDVCVCVCAPVVERV